MKWIAIVTLTALVAAGAVTNWPSAQYLMVDQHGLIQPPGYAAGLSEIAQAEAVAEAAAQAAQLVQDTTVAASNVVDSVVTALTGAVGFGYVQGYNLSFAGLIEISTNVTSQMLLLDLEAAGTLTTNGIEHSGHYIWHVYSEAVNSIPAIKYRTNLDATNAWELAEYQSTAEFQDVSINGVQYDVAYRSTVWMPATLNTAFFMAFCEITGGGEAGGILEVYEGFSVNGHRGFTGTLERDGFAETYDDGLLMKVEALP